MALLLCDSSSDDVEGDRPLELAGQPASPGQIGGLSPASCSLTILCVQQCRLC